MDNTDYKAFFENSVDMMCAAGFDGYFKNINKAFYQTLGYSKEELLSKPFISFVHPNDVAATLNEVEKLASGVRTIHFENRYQHNDGHFLWIGWSGFADLQNQMIYGIAREITEQKQMAANLIVLSHTDTITSIPNRRAFDIRMESEWNVAMRYHHPISIIMIDIDKFKSYNDHYGHQMGDECIRTIAQCLNKHLPRANNLVARVGGDEFAVVLAHESFDKVCKTAEYLRQAVEQIKQPHKYNTDRKYVTITAGVATTIPGKNSTVANLLAVADKSLYEAKRAGRNCCRGHLMDHSSIN